MYRQIELYKTPRDILQKTSESYCEMTAEEHGFLCGLIKTFCPKKVVEVGVAGGGIRLLMHPPLSCGGCGCCPA